MKSLWKSWQIDIKDLFNQTQTIQDVSGAGNNWAHGFGFYGPQYEEEIIEKVEYLLGITDLPKPSISWGKKQNRVIHSNAFYCFTQQEVVLGLVLVHIFSMVWNSLSANQ